MGDDYITSFLFPDENISYVPSDVQVQNEKERIEHHFKATSFETSSKCQHCGKTFSYKSNLDRHLRKGVCLKEKVEIKCHKCGKEFKKRYDAKRHEKMCGVNRAAECKYCDKVFATGKYLENHFKCKHTLRCPLCGSEFLNKVDLVQHCRGHMKNDYLTLAQVKKLRNVTGKSLLVTNRAATSQSVNSVGPMSPATHVTGTSEPSGASLRQTSRPILGNAGVQFTMEPTGLEKHSMLNMFSERREQLHDNLADQLQRWNNVRWYICVNARMVRFDSEGNLRDEDRPTFRANSQVLLVADAIEEQIDRAFFKANSALETFCSSASGWVLDEVLRMDQFILKYDPMRGNCGDLDLPPELSQTRALITVTGRPTDSKDCFLWATIAGLHHDATGTHSGSVHWSNFQTFRHLYRFPEGLSDEEAVTVAQVPEFEKHNRISLNVFAYDGTVFPLHVSSMENARAHADLLLLHVLDQDDDGDASFKHYCAITNLGRLVHHQQAGSHTLHVCPRCLNFKYSPEALQKHVQHCSQVEPVKVKMPEFERRFQRFKSNHLKLEAPFVIIARFECFRRPIMDINEPTEGGTVRERIHELCAFSYYRMSVDNSHPCPPVFFTDNDPAIVMREFLTCMHREQEEALSIMKSVAPMVYCDEGLKNIEASNFACHICGDPFLSGQKVCLDHSHTSGKIRGRSHMGCNLNFRDPNHIIVVLDDLSEYDGRIVMAAASIHGARNIRVIPKTIDTYAGITIEHCRYIDMKSFFKDPLDSLVEGLRAEEGVNCFTHTHAHWPSDRVPEALERISLCRDYIHGPEQLRETSLPAIEAFADRIEERCLSPENYMTVIREWENLEDKTLKGLMKLSLVTDCLFTADIFSKFRQVVRKDLKLDPMRFYTMASFAWQSALHFSEVTLELQTSLEAHLMIENAIRGGIAVVGNPRYAEANNPDMLDFNEEEEVSYLHFLDFNGLYTGTMESARLPAYGFRFLSSYELETFDFEGIPEDSDKGFLIECDISYCPELHDSHDDFPLAPEKISVRPETLSEYTAATAKSCGINLENMCTEKRLCLTLRDKKLYTCHYRTLQFYVKHGLRVTKIHRVLEFTQIQWLQSFMKYCSEKRQAAKSTFYKSMWKNIANLVSGKSYENPRNYKDVRICTSEKSLTNLVSKPAFECLRVLGDNLTAVQMRKTVVELNKPIAVGFTILELSKLEVYSFYYDFVKPILAKDGKVSFLAGDTDSMVLKISGVNDLNDRFKKNKHLFDFSNMPDGHPLKNNTNRLKPGKVKFELPGHVGLEFIALSPKCYSMKTDQGFKQARKGCSRAVRHELYKECLLQNKCHTENENRVRNYGQQLYQVSVSKRALNILDLKRFYHDAFRSVSLGHHTLDS